MPTWIQAALWGWLAGSALLLGSVLGYTLRLPQRLIAGVMSFGAGVLISALSFDLMDEAYHQGGFEAAALGFLGGVAVFSWLNLLLARHGAKHRKRSGDHLAKDPHPDAGLTLALGALLDGIPESIVIGVSLVAGGAVSVVAVAAVFLSNVPEALSSSAGMKKAGKSRTYVFGLWGGIAAVSGLASLGGYALFQHASSGLLAATTAVAAGAILTMLADTMIPEASEGSHGLTGLITGCGFLMAFLLTKVG